MDLQGVEAPAFMQRPARTAYAGQTCQRVHHPHQQAVMEAHQFKQPHLAHGAPCLMQTHGWQQAAPSRPGPLSVQPLPVEHCSQPGHSRRHKRARLTRPSAGAMDVMPAWTLDQIAGLLFGVRVDTDPGLNGGFYPGC
eukprot:scaffold37735_cov17-Tisochrysis_lutea.AAC.2